LHRTRLNRKEVVTYNNQVHLLPMNQDRPWASRKSVDQRRCILENRGMRSKIA